MLRNCRIEDISDGRRYREQDMVKIACEECKGCSACCRNMEDTIVLDPYDVWNLTIGTGKLFQEYLNREIQLKITDGLILPHLAMKENNCCYFLSEEGRCTIHKNRPGICQLFPLGRIYEKEDYYYFIQNDQCQHPLKSKIKLSKWIGDQATSWYHDYVLGWHRVIKTQQGKMVELPLEEAKERNMELLQVFYLNPFHDFQREIMERIQNWNERVK